jgi:hypothetical protein
MKCLITAALLACLSSLSTFSEVPQLMNYQGRIQIGPANFDGVGQFKFALVNANGTTTLWSNDGTSVSGSEPGTSVALPVIKGLYAVMLGDTTRPNMSALPGGAFSGGDVYLRVWFNDGQAGSQQLRPDQRIASVGFALQAGSADTLDGLDSTFFTAKTAEVRAQLDASVASVQQAAATLDAELTSQIDSVNAALTAKDLDLQAQINGIMTGEVDAHAALSFKFDVKDIDLQNQINDVRTAEAAAHTTLNTKIDTTAAALQTQIDNAQVATSLIQFSQGFARVSYTSQGDTKNIDEISMAVPAAGYLHVTAFVNASISSVSNSKYSFILYDATVGQVELVRGVQLFAPAAHDMRGTPSLSWVVEVSGPKTVTLRTQGVLENGNSMETFGHNLTAVYVPRRAQ